MYKNGNTSNGKSLTGRRTATSSKPNQSFAIYKTKVKQPAVLRQKTLSSFFFKTGSQSPKKASHTHSLTEIVRSSEIESSSQVSHEKEGDVNHPIDLDRFSGQRPSLLFDSQGSFDEECDPDAEIKKLINVPKLNNFKEVTLSRSPSFQRSTSSLSHHVVENDTDDDNDLKDITKIKAGSRQLSFTSTQSATLASENTQLNFSQSTQTSILSQSTQVQRSSKRSISPTRTSSFQGLKLSAPKRIKPIVRQKSSLSSTAYGRLTQEFKLTKEQELVIDLIIRKRLNVFYTGSAGTGKSVILKTIISKLGSIHGKEAIAITASTGLAATTIGGTTLHKWAGVGLGDRSADQLANSIQRRKDVLNSWKNTRVLIIDEISMIDGLFLTKLETVARTVRRSNRPFGGIQLVLTGDFFQLPPIQKRDSPVLSQFCFESKMWSQCIQRTILLTKVFRQQDNELVDILNSIRFGEIDQTMAAQVYNLKRKVNYDDGIAPTELYATRREVEISNSRQLKELPGIERRYESDDAGTPELIKLLDSSLMVEKIITLKEDAQVMMLKNKPEVNLVNGSLGKVLFFTTERLYRKMMELYRGVDDDVIIDMKMVSRAIGERTILDNKQFSQDVASRPRKRLPILQELINLAMTETRREEVLPFVRWSVGQGKVHHDIVLRDVFPVDVPGDKVGLQRTQLPIMLCWALSIHKSQGQTIQRLKVDLKNIFEAGQVYVALSRAVSKEQLQVLNFSPSKIRSNDKVKEFYKKLETVTP
ncbi:DNA helicase NDAI_0D01610 [Naumovozyma dairenensis CBS 421]|uniref:ATP-dependent DNA helicase RRM3 n=1 Tax=Naumovozyma dairenensis (strain ATCC 10597 / BCRC 20456 / CBS 421 / NBRC 0211 / NRRL Y-12639) TaxID=1071378 RepID=G0W9L4_NAUDC|nr:hypothetical protein NDAI_0D01610 [Naumovozyma dairenensis CBS 421]CCD24475.1 hypothetical protein NDAI_0D01610 [Naumovozyma dairenensis CBS 421]